MEKNGSTTKFMILLIILSMGVLAASILSVMFGTAGIVPEEILNSLFRYDPLNSSHAVIRDLRIPRTLGDIAVGAAFAVSGAIMQGMTRNPLADAGILGINSGAVFALSLCLALLPGAGQSAAIICSFGGAALAAFIVYGLTGLRHGKQSPVRLALAGTAVATLFSALGQAVALHYHVGQEVTFWTAGSVAGIRFGHLVWALPFIGIALAGAVLMSRSLSVLSVGEETARGLGIRVERTKLMGMILVLLLAGAAVSLSGPVTFVGLMVPHIVRMVTGPDYRKIIPGSMVLGSFAMLLADLLSRVVNPPYETPVGLIFAVTGVPFFLYLTRTERRGRNV